MAKDNIFLGNAYGAIGDVVISRVDGRLVTRARNRHPRNPQTDKQLIQRAIMLTCFQAYKAGKEIFCNSFEGCNTPRENFRRFISLNARHLRNLLADDINQQRTKPSVFLNKPKTIRPVGSPFIISDGSLHQTYFNINDDFEVSTPPTESDAQQVSDYMLMAGLSMDDIYTLAFIIGNSDSALEDLNYYYPTDFAWIQFSVKENISMTGQAESLLWDTFFDITTSDNVHFALYDESLTGQTNGFDDFLVKQNNCPYILAAGIIKSNAAGQRSYTEMVINGNSPGLTYKNVIDGWKHPYIPINIPCNILDGANF